MIGSKRGSVELLSHQEEWDKNAENVIFEDVAGQMLFVMGDLEMPAERGICMETASGYIEKTKRR